MDLRSDKVYKCPFSLNVRGRMLFDWTIDWIENYTYPVSAIVQPCNGGLMFYEIGRANM